MKPRLIALEAVTLGNFGGQAKRRSLRFYLLIVVLVSYTVAMVIRVFDANIQGDIWLAFSRRSDVGWPMAHILALIALVALLFAIFGVKRKRAL